MLVMSTTRIPLSISQSPQSLDGRSIRLIDGGVAICCDHVVADMIDQSFRCDQMTGFRGHYRRQKGLALFFGRHRVKYEIHQPPGCCFWRRQAKPTEQKRLGSRRTDKPDQPFCVMPLTDTR